MLVEGLLIGRLRFHPPNSESPSRRRRISGRERRGGARGGAAGAKVAAATVEGITETSCEGGEISLIKGIYQGVIFWAARSRGLISSRGGARVLQQQLEATLARACTARQQSDAEDASSRNITFRKPVAGGIVFAAEKQ